MRIVALAFALTLPALADDVLQRDGTLLEGKIISESKDAVVLEVKGKKVSIDRSHIECVFHPAEGTFQTKAGVWWSGGKNAHVTVALLTPPGEYVDVDFWRSTVVSWKDSAGGDLGAKDSGIPDYAKEACFASVQGDPPEVEILSPTDAAEGATTVAIEGVLRFRHASKHETGKTGAVAIAKGTTFEVAGLKCEVVEVTAKEKGYEFSVKFVGPGDEFLLEEMNLLDAEGTKVFGGRNTQTSPAPGGGVLYEVMFYGSDPLPAQTAFEWSVWTDCRGWSLPFKWTMPKKE